MQINGPISAEMGEVSDTRVLVYVIIYFYRLSSVDIIMEGGETGCPELDSAVRARGLEVVMIDSSYQRFIDVYCL